VVFSTKVDGITYAALFFARKTFRTAEIPGVENTEVTARRERLVLRHIRHTRNKDLTGVGNTKTGIGVRGSAIERNRATRATYFSAKGRRNKRRNRRAVCDWAG